MTLIMPTSEPQTAGMKKAPVDAGAFQFGAVSERNQYFATNGAAPQLKW
jgi:hypothetical protein